MVSSLTLKPSELIISPVFIFAVKIEMSSGQKGANKDSLWSGINVARLLEEPVGSTRNYHMDESIGEETMHFIKGEVTLTRSSQGILMQGTLTAHVELVCSRCLNAFDLPINFNIAEEFLPTFDVHTGLPLALPEECDNLTIDEDHVLDFGEVVRQYILLNMPMRPLCHPDCAGFYLSADHSPGRNSHETERCDYRWSKLKQLNLDRRGKV